MVRSVMPGDQEPSWSELMAAKDEARRADAEALCSGRVSHSEMRKRNEFLRHLDLSKGRLAIPEEPPEL
jgi:hypothetical protein